MFGCFRFGIISAKVYRQNESNSKTCGALRNFCCRYNSTFYRRKQRKVRNLNKDDKILPNDKGHQIYADTIYNVIDEQVDNNTSYDSAEIEPLNDGVVNFDKLKKKGV